MYESMKEIKVQMKHKTNVECSPENKSRGKGSIISEVFDDYCSSTSLHGIGYLGAKDKSLPEKVWWIIVVILSLTSCSFLITKTWIKWKADPVILSFEKEQIHVWEIPFPAVTICPVNKVIQTFYNYTKIFRNRNNLTDEAYKEFWDVSLVCNLQQYQIEFNCTLNTTDEQALAKIIKYAQPVNYSIIEDKWQNKPPKNDKLFSNQITEEGLCYTFNSLSQEDMYTKIVDGTNIWHEKHNTIWDVESGYKSTIKKTDYPRRTTKSGIASGLSFKLRYVSYDNDIICGPPIRGYKIIIHNPAEVPIASQQYFMVSTDKKVNIIIKPELTITSTVLKSLPSETRKCYFDKEKSLRFFKVYSQTNCRIECDANVTLQYCGCVPFYFPRAYNMPICGFAKNKCIDEVETTLIDVEMTEKGLNVTEGDRERIEKTREIYEQCKCLPSCNSLQYSAEITQSEYYIVEHALATGFYEEELSEELIEALKNGTLKPTAVDIFFKQSQFYALKRSEIYGRVDFLANIGGLLGLFMGFSILSLLEIVYFLTIRIWFKCKNRQKNI